MDTASIILIVLVLIGLSAAVFKLGYDNGYINGYRAAIRMTNASHKDVS